MTRSATLFAITVLSLLATPVVVNATATTPRTETAAVAPAATATQAETAAPASPACTVRKVRIVYAGFGEGQGAACAPDAQR